METRVQLIAAENSVTTNRKQHAKKHHVVIQYEQHCYH